MKDINLDDHIKVFKKVIRVNGETMKVDIINLFGFTLQNFIQDHPNCTFDELEQAFYKHFQTMKNDEKVYM